VQYVLLGLAGDTAIQGAQVETACAAADELATRYAVDGLKRKADVLVRLDKVKGVDAAALGERSTRLVDEAIGADRYDVARQAAEQVAALAMRAGDRAAVQAAAARQQEVKTIEAGHEQAKKALATLASEPNNTAAYLIVGRFLCFFKSDWEKGVPMLSNSSDKGLKAVADKELAKPTEAAKQVELADGWWDAGQKEQGLAKRNMRDHAAEWYQKALPSLKGMLKLKAGLRLEEWKEAQAAAPGRTTGEVVIVKATYGIPGVPWAQLDVTSSLQRAIPKDPFVVIQPDNRVFGDPAVGQYKRLLVEYRCGDNRGKLNLAEADVAVIPPIPVMGVRLSGASKELTIVAARFGSGLTWFDVTRQAAALVTDPDKPFCCPNFGQASNLWSEGQKKRLAIWFDYQGTRYVRSFVEGETSGLLR
ncbi:MAG: hypothetical protein WCK05_15845, partial [Planctomycetota bacterium]